MGRAVLGIKIYRLIIFQCCGTCNLKMYSIRNYKITEPLQALSLVDKCV